MSQIPSQTAEQRRQQLDFATSIAKLYFRHASVLFAHYDAWKDNDAFYFIELRLDMAYVSTGFSARIADPPYFLGTIVRNSLEHPDLFGCKCPDGYQAYAYTYSGSPLSGRVSQAVACPECGWNEWTKRQGWHVRSRALKGTQAEDLERFCLLKKADPDFHAADLRDRDASAACTQQDLPCPPCEGRCPLPRGIQRFRPEGKCRVR